MTEKDLSRGGAKRVIVTVLLAGVCLAMFVPLFFAVINSFKPYSEMMTSFVTLPSKPDFDNYIRAWKVANYQRSFVVSLLITIFSTAGVVLFSSMAAYKLAPFTKRGF